MVEEVVVVVGVAREVGEAARATPRPSPFPRRRRLRSRTPTTTEAPARRRRQDVGRGRDTYLRPLRPRVGLQQRDLPPRELQFQPLVGRLILIALGALGVETRMFALDLHQRVGGELARGPPSCEFTRSSSLRSTDAI